MKAVKCSSCLQEIDYAWRFCPHCATAVQHSVNPGVVGWTADKIDNIAAGAFFPGKGDPKNAGSGHANYGEGVRAQVFEVIVRQAMAGAPWREICAAPMHASNIDPDDVEAEVQRRRGSGGARGGVPKNPGPLQGGGGAILELPSADQQIAGIRDALEQLGRQAESETVREGLENILGQLQLLTNSIYGLEHKARTAESEARLQSDLERENARVRQPWTPGNQ